MDRSQVSSDVNACLCSAAIVNSPCQLPQPEPTVGRVCTCSPADRVAASNAALDDDVEALARSTRIAIPTPVQA